MNDRSESSTGARTSWLGMLRLTRASIALSPLADGLAGMAIAATVSGWPSSLRIATGMVTALALFCFGMAQNDLSDRQRDVGTRRPLATGEVRVATARIFVIALAIVCLALAWTLPSVAGAIVVVMLIAISSYNLSPIHLGWLGPLVLGAIRGLDLALGAAIGGAVERAIFPAIAYAGFIGAISCISRMEDGVWRPSRERVLAATVVAALCAASGPALVHPAGVDSSLLLSAGCVVLWLGWIARCFRGLPRGPLTAGPALQRYVGACLSAIFFFDAALAARAGAWGVALVILLMFPIARALVRALPPS